MPVDNYTNDKPPATRLVLKIDVDTKVGFLEGTPRLMDILGRLGVTASFFVAMGPDHSGRALKRIFRPGFLRKQLRSKAASAYGLETMMYGLLLPGPIIARSAPRLLSRLMDAGFEVGLHGWDHVFWHDRLRGLDIDRVRLELGQAYNLFLELSGQAPASFAAPGWQATSDAYQVLSELGVSHVSCGRGSRPYRPLVGGRALPLIELPTTLPTFDELMDQGLDADGAARELAGLVRPGELNVFTLHGEVEGRELAPQFEALCAGLLDRGVVFQTLHQAARRAVQNPLPVLDPAFCTIKSRAYEVACGAGESLS